MTADTTSARLDALEERIAHQDRTIEDLNDTITRQSSEIERLSRLLARLEASQADLAAALPQGSEPPPPHY